MLVVDNVMPIQDEFVEVPQYHSGHLSLKSETKVTLALLPLDTKSNLPQMHEIVVSPIAFESWQYLTRITAVFHDCPGIVRKLARAVSDLEFDLMYEESASIANGRFHRVEMLADASLVYAKYSNLKIDDIAVLSRVESRLKAICLNELAFDGTRPRLKVRPMEGLRNAWGVCREMSLSGPVTNGDSRSFIKPERVDVLSNKQYIGTLRDRGIERRTESKSVAFRIPDTILNALQQGIGKRAILVSDTKDRLLRMLVPTPETHFTYIRVNHNDERGAMARISERLALAFTAVLTLLRLKTQGERNDVELLLYSERYQEQAQEKRQLTAESLLCHESLSTLGIKVSYPERAGQRGPEPRTPRFSREFLEAAKEPPKLAKLDDGLKTKSTSIILNQRIKECRRTVQKETDLRVTATARVRLEAAKYLLAQEQDERLPNSPIFTSFEFNQDFLDLYKEVLRPRLMREGCEPVDGIDLRGDPIRNAIIERIKNCVGIICIWNLKGKSRAVKFSEWLSLEFSVAQAFELPYLILISGRKANDSPMGRVIPEKHWISFEGHTLEKILSDVFPKFLEEVREFERKKAVRRYREQTQETGT